MYKIRAGFNPRTPLRVDMATATPEDYRKVQEIFFTLGYNWRSQHSIVKEWDKGVPHCIYYNSEGTVGNPGPCLLWGATEDYNQLPTLTPQEFYSLVLEREPHVQD